MGKKLRLKTRRKEPIHIKVESEEQAIELNHKKSFALVFWVALAMLILKLFISFHAYGTNDIGHWKYFADMIEKFGTFKIYQIHSLSMTYNHPPLMSWVLKVINFISAKNDLDFPFVFRLMPILADYASIFVIWKLLTQSTIKTRVLICVICSVNPINFLISGFHGNTDPIFIFLILLAIYFTQNNNPIFAGLIYGLSMCIKIAPVILAPFFIYYFKIKKDKTIFLLFSLVIPLIIFSPYLINDCDSVTKNIFLYSSLKGNWGFGHIFFSIFNNENININIRQLSYTIFKFYNSWIAAIFLIVIVFLGKLLMTYKKINLVEGVFLAFSLFLAVTPGFGVQYLAWLSFFAIIVLPVLGSIYLLIGGFFLYRVYAYWGGAAPPYFANSYNVGQWVGFGKNTDMLFRVGQWVGFDKGVNIVLWLLVITMLIRFIVMKKYFLKNV